MDPIMFSFISLSVITLLFITIKLTKSTTNTKLLPPSPPSSLPILGHLHLVGKPLHLSLARLSSRHGPLLLLCFGSRLVLSVSSLSIAQQCFTTNDIAFASRAHLPSSKSITFNYTTLATAAYGPHWRNIRRIATLHLLSAYRINHLSHIRHSEVESLVSILFKEYITSEAAGEAPELGKLKKVELKNRLFGLAFNVIMRMIAGKRYYGEMGEEDEAMRFKEMVDETLPLLGASNASDFMPLLRLVDFGGVKKKMRRLEAKREVVLQGLIDVERKRKQRGEENTGNLMEILLGFQEEDPEYYTDVTIKAFMVTLLFAGTDTSTDTIEWAMSFLLNHPAALITARNEIDAVVENGRLLQEEDLPNLPYLQAIINETLRLCPVAPLLLPHESIQECTVEGYTVPPGTMLLVNAYAIHRDPSIWENPLQFKPERFSDGGNNIKNIIPFGMGRRRCPGDVLATKTIGLVLGTLIQCFEWERIGEEMVDMSEAAGLTLHKLIPLEPMYRPRLAMIDVLSQI